MSRQNPEDARPAFQAIDPLLPEAEQQFRQQRQQHAEWGIALAQLSGVKTTAALFEELQRYIDGDMSLAALAELNQDSGEARALFQAVARREQFAG